MQKQSQGPFESINRIVGSLNILKIVLDIDTFLEWVDKNHPEVKKTEIFLGYRFLIESAICTFANTLHLDSSLIIEEDYVYFRATHFTDINFKKFPVTCEKTALMKNIQNNLLFVLHAGTFNKLRKEAKIFSTCILIPFSHMQNKHCGSISGFSYDEAIKFSAMRTSQIFLSDTSKGIPLGFIVSPLKRPIKKAEFSKIFLGYKIGLQYLWFVLVGKDQFETSGLNRLNEASDWVYEEPWPPSIQSNHDSSMKRTDLDTYFSVIQDKIIEPLEERRPLIKSFNFFHLKGRTPKRLLKPLLSYHEELKLSVCEKIRFNLLWYDVELLDSSQEAIFNGVPAFLTLLTGSIQLKQKLANGEEAIICKFIHPSDDGNNDYTYGVLIESQSGLGLSDYSGWILCYDCCGDDDAFSGFGHDFIESLLIDYEKQKKIILKEMVIEKAKFKKCVKDLIIKGFKTKSALRTLKYAKPDRILVDKLQLAKGLIPEFLTYYVQSQKNEGKVDWKIKENKGQKDVTCDFDNRFLLIECKLDPNTIRLEKEFFNIDRKLRSIKTNKEKIGQFWFYRSPNPLVSKRYRELQNDYAKKDVLISDYYEIEENLKTERIWRNTKLNDVKWILGK